MTECECGSCGVKGEGYLFTHVSKSRDSQGCLIIIKCPSCQSRDVDVFRVEPPKNQGRKSRLKEVTHVVEVYHREKLMSGTIKVTTRVYQ